MHIWLVALWALFVASALVDSAAVHRRVKRGDLEKIIGGVKGVGHLLGFRSDKILKKGSNLLAKIGDRPIVGKVVSHLMNSNDDDAGDTEVEEEQKPKVANKPKIHRKSFEEYANMEEDEWAELKKSERRKALRRFPKLAKLHASVDE